MANRFQHLIDGTEEKNKPSSSANVPSGNRFSSLLKQTAMPTYNTMGNYRTLDNAISQVDPNPVVGENLFLTNTLPIRQNDTPFIKGGKGLVNIGTSILSVPGEALRKISLQGGSLLSGNGLQELPKNTSFTQDILPKGASSALSNFQQSNPILGGLATMGLETVVDPIMYLGGGAKNIVPESKLGAVKPTLETPSIKPQQALSEPIQSPNVIKSLNRFKPKEGLSESPILNGQGIPAYRGFAAGEATKEANLVKPNISRAEIKLKPRELTAETEIATHPVAEHILNKLDDIESATRARIQANKGRALSGLPVDTLLDYSILGGVKIARGAVKYSVWASEMVKDLGDEVKPHLKAIWGKSKEQHASMVDGTFKPNIPEGQVERGFSRNTRTDINNPDTLRDSFTTNALSYEQLGNPETLAKAQAIVDQGFPYARTQLVDLANRVQPEAIPLAKILSRQAAESGNVQEAREIISIVAEKLTQAGQFSQAARILREADPETFLLTIGKQLKTLNKKGAETYGKKWTNVELTPDEIKLVSNIKRGDQQAYEEAFEQIGARIADEMPASAFEKINAYRHMAMLLNPKTHIRNVGGNAIMLAMRKSAQRVSGVLQKALPAEERTQAVLVNKEYKNLASDYFNANKKDLLSGANKYQEGLKLGMQDKRVFRKSRIGEKLGYDIDTAEQLRKFNYALLQMGDTPFFKNAYIDRLASYAQSKGIKDFSKLKPEAFDIARLEAEQATYKDAAMLADFINKVKNPGKDASILRKGGAVLTEAALPFTKTPINILKRGMQYSPIGLVNGLASIKSAKGAAAAIDEIAKGLTGTAIIGLGYLLSDMGILTGKAEKDVDLREYNKNTGTYPFSVLGKFSYDWMMPFSIPLSIGVEANNALRDDPKEAAKMRSIAENNDTSKLQQIAIKATSAIEDSLMASGDTMFNLSIMKGIKTLIGGGNKSFMEGMAQLPQGYATQFVPTLANQFAGIIDPTVREAYVSGNLPQSFKNALVSRIPGASTTLQPKQTPFGEDVKKIENPFGRAFAQLFSPGIITKDQKVDPKIDEELRRLNEYGLTKQFPTMVENYIAKTSTHPRIELTPTEKTKYQKRVGQLTLSSFNKVLKSGDYRYARAGKGKTVDEVKADLLAEAISDAKAQAKKEILKGRGLK